ELAAARVREHSLAAILERLTQRFELLADGPRDQPPRLRALRAALDWSHDLLSAAEQALLARLGVFSGGFTAAAVEAVCSTSDAVSASATAGLAHLAAKSLVRAVPRSADQRRAQDEEERLE